MIPIEYDLEEDVLERIAYAEVLNAIRELPVLYRDVLYLQCVEEYKLTEISRLLGIEAETVKKRAQRGRKKLIRRADHPIRHRIAQAAACLLLAALLSGCTPLAVSPETRAAFVGWVREIYGAYVKYRCTGENQAIPQNMRYYRPAWIPEGY